MAQIWLILKNINVVGRKLSEKIQKSFGGRLDKGFVKSLVSSKKSSKVLGVMEKSCSTFPVTLKLFDNGCKILIK